MDLKVVVILRPIKNRIGILLHLRKGTQRPRQWKGLCGNTVQSVAIGTLLIPLQSMLKRTRDLAIIAIITSENMNNWLVNIFGSFVQNIFSSPLFTIPICIISDRTLLRTLLIFTCPYIIDFAHI